MRKSLKMSKPSLQKSKPCGACSHNRTRCTPDCVLAPYFSYPDSKRDFRPVHKLYGTRNFIRLLRKIPIEKRPIAVRSFIYEAQQRYKEPILGSSCYIIFLETQLSKLKEEIVRLEALVSKAPPSAEREEHPNEKETEVQEQTPKGSKKHVKLSTDSELVEVEVQHYLAHLSSTPSFSWLIPVSSGDSESSSLSTSPNSPLSPTISVSPVSLLTTPPVTQDNPTGSHPTWAALLRHCKPEYFNDISIPIEGPNIVSSFSDPMFVEPISAIPASPGTHPYSFFDLPCIRTKRVNSNSCSSSRSISPMKWPL